MRRPTISIGMPAYNSAATIQMAIEALLAQSCGDFELIVSDNASNDATPHIVSGLAAHDTRIRYVSQAQNIGANGNYSHVARLAQGRYFKWASSSDWCAPTFLEKCLRALEQDPAAVVCVPRTRLFSGDLGSAVDYAEDIEVTDATPATRLEKLVAGLRLNNAMNGLIRMSALRRTRLIDPFYQADEVLLGHLAMLGPIVLLDEFLFFRRMDPSTATSLQDKVAWRNHHYPVVSAKVLFQTWKRHGGWMRAWARTPASPDQRLALLGFLLRMLYWDRGVLLRDVGIALRYAAGAGTPE